MENRVAISPDEFKKLQELIKDFAGITLQDNKEQLAMNRLSDRLLAGNFTNFTEYFNFLATKKDKGEIQEFVNRMTTNKTDFFREQAHFDYIKRELRPHILDIIQRRQAFHVLSAACSTGQEPYSIAMTFADVVPDADFSKVSIEGIDINSEVLQTARAGVYPSSEVVEIETPIKRRFFLKGEGRVKVKDFVRKQVSFHVGSLIEPNTYRGKTYDMIFCRNMMIYLNRETQTQLVARLYEQLKPDGYFFPGHSENIQLVNTDFKMVHPAVYVKTS